MNLNDYRRDHHAKYAPDKVTEAGKGLGITNSEYSNGRRTSGRGKAYYDFLDRARAESEARKR